MTETITLIVSIIIFNIAGPLSAIHAILHSHSAQGAIAWVISLFTIPYIALPLYWLFGHNHFEKYRLARQEAELQINAMDSEIDSTLVDSIVASDTIPELAAAEKLARFPTFSGNQVELLIDGEVTFDSIFSHIEHAQEYILIQFFIIRHDSLGQRLKELLISKSQQGIAVYFLYDKVGSRKLKKEYWNQLRESGVYCFDFNAKKGPSNRLSINFRNHRKIVVVDGETAWIGGHNVGDEYLGRGKLGEWRDTHIRVKGPGVYPILQIFCEDWYWASGEILQLPVALKPCDNAQLLILGTGPGDSIETAELMFVHAIQSARFRVWIASPYFVPSESIINALRLACLKGVDVRILIPDNPDHLLVYWAAFSFMTEVAHMGVTFYRYQKGFMHQKVLLIDNDLSAVGTANFDNRSFRLNFEITGFVISEEFNERVAHMLLDDFEASHKVSISEFDEYSFLFWLKIRAARLFAPLL